MRLRLFLARICSKHFSPESFFIPLKHRLLNYYPVKYRNLKSDAIPTEFLPKSSSRASKASERGTRYLNRDEQKKRLNTVTEILTSLENTVRQNETYSENMEMSEVETENMLADAEGSLPGWSVFFVILKVCSLYPYQN